MSNCNINFTKQDNDLAFELYEQLIKAGVTCEQMSQGYTVISYRGTECPEGEDTCVIGADDGILQAEEVLEYGLNNYQVYQRLLEGVLGYPIPWVLDDLDPSTEDDAEIRGRVQEAIELLDKILTDAGFEKKTEEYQTRLALGLFWLATYPSNELINRITDEFKAELESTKKNFYNIGLSEFWNYLSQNGGFGVVPNNELSAENDALNAIKDREGECTESSKVLFAIFKMAGFDPKFAISKSYLQFEEDLKRLGVSNIDDLYGAFHVIVALKMGTRNYFFDSLSFVPNAPYKNIYVLSLRLYLAMDRSNVAMALVDNGQLDDGIAALAQAIEIDTANYVAYINRGVVFEKKGEIKRAIEDYTASININPNEDIAFNARAHAWFDLREWDKAIEDYRESIRLNPKRSEPFEGLGYAFIEKKDYDKAIENVTEAIKLDHENADLLLRRACLWLYKEDTYKAIEDLASYFKLENSDFSTAVAELRHTVFMAAINSAGIILQGIFLKESKQEMGSVKAYFLLSVALWNADKKGAALNKFNMVVDSLEFVSSPSEVTKKILKDMLALLPDEMKGCSIIESRVKKLEVIINAPAKFSRDPNASAKRSGDPIRTSAELQDLLVRLADKEKMKAAIKHIRKLNMNEAEAIEYVKSLLENKTN